MYALGVYVTDKEIAQAEALGACDAALTWLRAKPRTWDETIERQAAWLLRYAAEHLTSERLDACAVDEPVAALYYAAARLTPAQIEAGKAAF